MAHPVCSSAGRLFNTLFGNHDQRQQASPSETSPHDTAEGSPGHAHAQAGSEEQQVAGAETQHLPSNDRDKEGMPTEVTLGERGSEEQSMHQRPSHPPAAEQQASNRESAQEQWLQKASPQEPDREADEAADRVADEEADREADGSTAKTEAALAAAQEAQEEALQAEKEALGEERQSLMQVRDDLQQASGQPRQNVFGHELYIHEHFLTIYLCLPSFHPLTILRLWQHMTRRTFTHPYYILLTPESNNPNHLPTLRATS